MSKVSSIIKDLRRVATPARAKASAWFFKTGKGEYGEGDVFWGITVPQQRVIAKKYTNTELKDIEKLLKSKVHEQRLVGILILVDKYVNAKKDPTTERKVTKEIYDFYLKNTKHVNNWDLVDTSAPYIVGDYLLDRKRNILYRLAISKNLWERRIAIITTSAFIRCDDFKDTLRIAERLLYDFHDLIHKAVGWMLREVGKRDQQVLEFFLAKHYKKMPRTMLRYAIEKLNEKKRQFYLR